MNQQKSSKYNNSIVYFDPFTNVAYRDIPFGTREFKSLTKLSSLILNRCYRFDSIHEYYSYRVALFSLPAKLQLLKQVNFLVIPKSELGAAVTYRADLVIAPKDVHEKSVRYHAMQPQLIPFEFLIVEPKGILTDSARLKHLMLCATNKVPIQQILFVASNYESLKLPSDAKTTLFHLSSVLKEKLDLIFGD